MTPRVTAARCRWTIVAAVLLVFGRLLWCDFTWWDDPDTVHQNPALNPVTLQSFLGQWERPTAKIYIPLTYGVWSLLTFVARVPADPLGVSLDPAVFHAANVLVHAAGGLAAFALLRRLVKKRHGRTAGGAAVGRAPGAGGKRRLGERVEGRALGHAGAGEFGGLRRVAAGRRAVPAGGGAGAVRAGAAGQAGGVHDAAAGRRDRPRAARRFVAEDGAGAAAARGIDAADRPGRPGGAAGDPDRPGAGGGAAAGRRRLARVLRAQSALARASGRGLRPHRRVRLRRPARSGTPGCCRPPCSPPRPRSPGVAPPDASRWPPCCCSAWPRCTCWG